MIIVALMRTPDSRHGRRPFRQHLWLVAILLLALAAASLMGNRGLFRLYQMHRAKAALEHEIERLTTANTALADEVRALQADPARVEAIAREELGLVKPGEIVYEFQTPPRTSTPAR